MPSITRKIEIDYHELASEIEVGDWPTEEHGDTLLVFVGVFSSDDEFENFGGEGTKEISSKMLKKFLGKGWTVVFGQIGNGWGFHCKKRLK